MGLAIFIKEYISWHYGRAITEIIELEKNFLWFGYYLFSFKLLLKTLLSPLYRIKESYKGWTNIEFLLENFIANAVSRVVGFVLRIFVLTVGAVFEIAVAIVFVPVLSVWIVLPALIPMLFLLGLSYVI